MLTKVNLVSLTWKCSHREVWPFHFCIRTFALMSSLRKKWWYAFITMKCPRCRHGSLFTHRNPYNLKHLGDMPQHCPVCGQTYFPEVGFYWGAMYVSYGVTVFVSAVNVALIWSIFGFHLWFTLIENTLLLFAGLPLFYRYSRAIWLSVFVRFSDEAFELAEKKEAVAS
jgi:hypothetical protein